MYVCIQRIYTFQQIITRIYVKYVFKKLISSAYK